MGIRTDMGLACQMELHPEGRGGWWAVVRSVEALGRLGVKLDVEVDLETRTHAPLFGLDHPFVHLVLLIRVQKMVYYEMNATRVQELILPICPC